MKQVSLGIQIIAGFLSIALVSSCDSMRESPPSPPIQIDLSMDAPPLLYEPEDLTCTVNSRYDLPSSTLQIKLPKGVNLLQGELERRVDILAKTPLTYSIRIVFVETGHFTIEATTKDNGGLDEIYLNIGEDHSEFGWDPTMPVPVTVSDPPPMVGLLIGHIPLLNEPVEITCTVSSSVDMPNIAVRLLLPMGAELIGGELDWKGDLQPGSPQTFSRQVMFKQQGRNGIGWQVFQAGKTTSWANQNALCLNIGQYQSSPCLDPTPVLPSSLPN